MNIDKFSKEAIQQLVLLAIEAAPTKVAMIMLNDGSATTATTATLSKVQFDRRLLFVIDYARSGQKVAAIKEFRMIYGYGLKESRDTIDCFLNSKNKDLEEFQHYVEHGLSDLIFAEANRNT